MKASAMIALVLFAAITPANSATAVSICPSDASRPAWRAMLSDLTGAAHITSPFGPRIHPIFHVFEFHLGADIAAPLGTPIHVQTAGIIEQAARRGALGLYIRVRHSTVFETAYAHLSAFADGIRPGVMVFAGDEIGKVGASGQATAPHLHYELRRFGIAINPLCEAPTQNGRPILSKKRGTPFRRKKSIRTAKQINPRRFYEKSK